MLESKREFPTADSAGGFVKQQQLTPKQLLVGSAVVFMVGLAIYLAISPWLNRSGSELNTVYGRRTGKARTSVNGTSVFAEMFRQQGGKISTWNQLSARLRRSNVIVWTPNSFELPSKEEIAYFEEEWLNQDDRPRTLVYVARDFDAAMEFWSIQAKNSQGSDFLEHRRKLARAESDHAYARSLTGREMDCDWFSMKSSQSFFEVQPDRGPWSSDLDPARARVTVAASLEIPDPSQGTRQYEVLLGSEETPLIVRLVDRQQWPTGQVIIVLNGASLLNLPLVDHENRKIAAQLIAACPEPHRVTFLESDPAGMRISKGAAKSFSGFSALTVWPMNAIVLHLVAAGVLFCAMVFPIFGRPRRIEDTTLSDFGKHIRAMGELLALSGDRETAMAKVRHYRTLKIEPIAGEPRPASQESGNPFKVSEV